MLSYTLRRGKLEWLLNGIEVTVNDLKEQDYYMTVSNWGVLIKQARGECDKHVSSSILQVLGMIYDIQFRLNDDFTFIRKLCELYQSVPNVPYPNRGICYNIDVAVGNTIDASNAVMNYFDEWFGNKSAYPVEGKLETQSTDLKKVGYLNNPKKWDKDTKFGLKRIELLMRLIEEVSDK